MASETGFRQGFDGFYHLLAGGGVRFWTGVAAALFSQITFNLDALQTATETCGFADRLGVGITGIHGSCFAYCAVSDVCIPSFVVCIVLLQAYSVSKRILWRSLNGSRWTVCVVFLSNCR